MDIDLDVTQFNDAPPAVPTHYHHAPFLKGLLACTACTCRAEAQRVVIGAGPRTAEIMFLGRNPGKDEDALGVPFIGKGGGMLDNWLLDLGLDRLKVVITNSVKCHTKKDRPPKPAEITTCTNLWLTKELEFLPYIKIIVALGNDATRFIIGPDAASTGQLIFYTVHVKLGTRDFIVIPLAHPGYLLRARQHIARMHSDVLPKMREYLMTEHKDLYVRAARS